LQSVIAQALNPIVAKVKSFGDQKQELELIKGDITHIATQMQDGFKMLADRTKALGKDMSARPGGGGFPPPLPADSQGPNEEMLRVLAVVEATRTEMHNAKSEMRMLHSEVKSLKEQKRKKERMTGPLGTSPVMETAGVSGSGMSLDISAPLSFVKEVSPPMVGGYDRKKDEFPKRDGGKLDEPIEGPCFSLKPTSTEATPLLDPAGWPPTDVVWGG
jgi:hypothetical protein